jgi:hypothetical protein
MSNIIGEPLEPYVIKQINARQKLHGSGVRAQNKGGVLNPQPNQVRTSQQIHLLTSNTSWVKLASGVSVSGSRLADIGFTTTQQELYDGMGLAKNNILFAGTSKLGINSVMNEQKGKLEYFDFLNQREGFLPRDPNSSYTYDSRTGFSPMAGIESVDIKTLNRGSLKKATVKLKANDRSQFDIIDLLYLRLGYTVLLEWGNSIFTPDGYKELVVGNTLIEDMFFNEGETKNKTFLDLLVPIEEKRNKYQGNYDGLLGKISNFTWSFNPDGTYDIELTIISLGDVIESLKTNISVDKATLGFLGTAKPLSATESDPETEPPADPQITEANKDTDIISAMLFAWKYVNPSPTGFSIDSTLKVTTPNITSYGTKVTIDTPDSKSYDVGYVLQNSQAGSELDKLTSTSYVVEFKLPYSYITKEDLDKNPLTDIQFVTPSEKL